MTTFPVTTLGIDIGTNAIKAVVVHGDNLLHKVHCLHKGRPLETLAEVCGRLPDNIEAMVLTGSGAKEIAQKLGIPFVEPATALIAAASNVAGARHIIDIGASSLSMADLDQDGHFLAYRTNSLCAAGTGSFLDEQATRMGLRIEEISNVPDCANPPRIAARCAVFAKSDLVHRQQEGYSIAQMWSGLCRGVAETALSALFRGQRPKGQVCLVGGVGLNCEVVKWLRMELGVPLIVPDDPAVFSALGAAHKARPIAGKINWKTITGITRDKKTPLRPKLKLVRSTYPALEAVKSYALDGTKIRIHEEISGEAILGIDIGSTSTKAVVLGIDSRVIADLYRPTLADPTAATQKILAAIEHTTNGHKLKIVGAGTTGSGRKMIGAIIGADLIVNEITAHAKAAITEEPDVETIFEIGGQDAKFISMRGGAPNDSNMNYVCAAGTGSFIEEQAARLGLAIEDVGDKVLGTRPPFSTDRCTVFMGQDISTLIQKGFDRKEVMGSVLYSVAQNYLNRVVGRRPFSRKKICFMGATARNKGLVAAFEQILDAPIFVSEFCHVMGALGVAQLVTEKVVAEKRPTSFRGLSIANAKITIERDTCNLCSNSCRISYALIGNNNKETAPSWGYLCGREHDETSMHTTECFELFRKRGALWRKNSATSPGKFTVGIPHALLTFTHLPLWACFFAELGMRVLLSRPTTTDTLTTATDFIGGEWCLPVKLAHGHVRELAGNPNVDAIFMPYIVRAMPYSDGPKRALFCPYNISCASIIKTSGQIEKTLLSPVIDFQAGINAIIAELERAIKLVTSLTRKQIKCAWTNALNCQLDFERSCEELGKKALTEIEENKDTGIVILGRPYNIYDLGSNLSLPRKIADMGFKVFTPDMLPLSCADDDPFHHNMYWSYGQKIIRAAKFVARHTNLFAIYLTNFACGPDSFLQTYVERIMRGKPILILELDEHGSDGAYITRLEAFRDIIEKTRPPSPSPLPKGERPALSAVEGVKERGQTLWIPPMHPYGSPLFAAAFRGIGRRSHALPLETQESFELAKRYCRGSECIPLPSTIGSFLSVLKKSNSPERECLFMPSANGPCRFGQYHTLHRIILDEAGYPNTPIETIGGDGGTYGTDMKTSRALYNAMLVGDLLYKARCRIRPYAHDRDAFDRLMEELLNRTIGTIENGGDLSGVLAWVAKRLAKVPRSAGQKPIVGIVGEIYVRLNSFINGNLVETIEDAGAEAWVTPATEWLAYLAFLDRTYTGNQTIGIRLKKLLKNAYMMRREHTLTSRMMPVISDRLEPPIKDIIARGERYLPRQFEGEAILTVGRAIEFVRNGAQLVINCAPFGCMPGTITSGIFDQIGSKLGAPVVSLFFDGESDLKPLVRTYVENIC